MITSQPSGASAPDTLPRAIGPFRVLSQIGRGGMGVVYRAQHATTGRPAALKTVAVSNVALLSSIRREIHALRSLEHPGVVRIVDEGVHGGVPWYAMELLEGRTMRDHNHERWRSPAVVDSAPTVHASAVDAGRTMTRLSVTTEEVSSAGFPRPAHGGPRPFHHAAGGALPEALTLLRAICAPLSFLHGRGLVHRDLKPDNVFIRDGGAPVLFDFGLAAEFQGARGRDVLQADGRLMGSPDYMAPEQIRGDLVDARADLYALGCMLFEAVTGTVPFLAEASSTVLAMHLFSTPPAASSLVEGVPAALDALIARLLEKRPQDRLGYADDVAEALARLGAAPPPPPLDRAPAVTPHLYRPGLAGRDGALRDLCWSLVRAQEKRKGSLVFLGGESGVGKTRLALEAATEAARAQMTVLTGVCAAVSAADAEGGGVRAAPLHPFRQLLLAVADRCQEEGQETYDRLLGPRGRLLAPFEPSLAQLPGHERYPEPPEVSADAARYRLRAAVADTLAALSERAPLLLLLDDLQWADASSRGVLKHLDATYFEEHAVVLLATYRTEEVTPALASLVATPWAMRIELGRLDIAAVGRMVSDMLAMSVPPTSFIAYLLEQSEGNPFFIAEYLRAAIQERLLVRDEGGAWRLRDQGPAAAAAPSSPRRPSVLPPPLAGSAAPPPGGASSTTAPLPLPGSLRDLVARRLERLSEGARALSRLAAVLGRELDEDVLVAAAGLDDVTTMEALAELSARQVLEEVGPSRLRFVHDKLREVAYAGIPDTEVRSLHGAAARAIEARAHGAADLARAYPLLAHHFGMAEVPDKTLEYLEKAGEQSLGTGASAEAIDFFRRAVELDQALPPAQRASAARRGRWARRLSQAHYNVGDLRGASEHGVRALELLSPESASIFSEGARPPGRRGAAAASAWQFGRQMAHLVGLRLAVADDPAERERLADAALASEVLSETYLFRNEPTKAFLAALTTTNAAARLGTSAPLARGYATLSVAFGYVPWPRVVEAYARRAAQTAAQLGDPQAAALVAFMRGMTLLGEGRCREARAHLTRAERIAHAMQDRRRQEESMALLGSVSYAEGRWQEALNLYGAIGASARRTDNAQGRVWADTGCAQGRILLGDGDSTVRVLAGAAEQVHALGDTSLRITWGQISLGYLLRGDRDAAREVAEQTLALLRDGQPAGYHCLFGYGATCEVLLSLQEGAATERERRELDPLATDALRALGRYARIFALGRSQWLRLRGIWHGLAGRRLRALRSLEAAVDDALRRGLLVDEARARLDLARRLGRDAPARARHLARARALFAQLDLSYWCEQVERLWAR